MLYDDAYLDILRRTWRYRLHRLLWPMLVAIARAADAVNLWLGDMAVRHHPQSLNRKGPTLAQCYRMAKEDY